MGEHVAETSALSNSLVKAMVEQLPMPGKPFPLAQRVDWLRMFAMTFNLAYGSAEPIQIVCDGDVPALPLRRVAGEPAAVAAPGAGSPPLAAAAAATAVAPPEDMAEAAAVARAAAALRGKFVVDKDGFALLDGLPINPEDIPAGTVLLDYRRDSYAGMPAAIMWKLGGTREADQLPPLNLQRAA